MGMIATGLVLTLKWQLAKRIPKHGSQPDLNRKGKVT
jgi:hypothetical protein